MAQLEISLWKLIAAILDTVFSDPEINGEQEREASSAELVVADPLASHFKGAAQSDNEVVAEQDVQWERNQLKVLRGYIIKPK